VIVRIGVLFVLSTMAGCALGVGEASPPSEAPTSTPGVPVSPSVDPETEGDWAMAIGAARWAAAQELHLLPVGEVIAILGERFVGTPYLPGTLELPGEERLVVRLDAFDCVTLVEHLVVLARITVLPAPGLLEDEGRFRARYREELTRLRYRDGVLAGYPSRLHYFSEWIQDAERKGILSDITAELGGIPDPRPIHFMSSNPGSYRQLSEAPALVEEIRARERLLSARVRHIIPQELIGVIEGSLRNGDIIAAVSRLDGLDIAHTGVAIQQGGRIHLLHAPLVGDSVEVSALPLAERILGIAGQTGIIVARVR